MKIAKRAGIGITCLLGLTAASIAQGLTRDDEAALKIELADRLDVAQLELVQIERPVDLAGDVEILLPLQGDMRVVSLSPHSVRAPGYQLLVQQPDGTFVEHQPGPDTTMRGEVQGLPGATVAAGWSESGLYGNVITPEGEIYWFEPVADRIDNAEPGLHAVYRGDDIIPTGSVCIAGEAYRVTDVPEGEIEASVGGPCGGICLAELGVDADYEFYADYGFSVVNTENRINLVINAMNNQYENQVQITHEISGIVVRTASGAPYNSANPDTLLNAIRSEWQNNIDIPHDVAQLFSGKNFQGSTIGLAWLGAVCTSLKYSIVESNCCGSFGCSTDLSAHELGHNWGAGHCSCPSFTMNPSITCSNNFTTSTRNVISNYRNSIQGCLDPGIPTLPGAFGLTNPANGAVDVELALFQWTASDSVENYQFQLDDDPDFSSPLRDTTTALTGVNFGFGIFEPGTVYYWRVRAFNDFGETYGTPNPSSFTSLGEAVVCEGDLDGDNDIDFDDLGVLLGAFGASADGDIDGDGDTDFDDLGVLLGVFGTSCN